jgi:transcriptional regulator with XRE-family HTH domain
MNDRIKLIIESRNLTASKFADEVGVQASSISHILSGRNKPSLEFIQKVLNTYPDINYEWLISGKGTMHKEISQSTELKEAEEAPQEAVNDLFTSSVEINVKEEEFNEISELEKEIEKEVLLDKADNKPINDDVRERRLPQENEIEEKTIPKKILQQETIENSSSSKEVDKLIILYKDRSFEIFQN